MLRQTIINGRIQHVLEHPHINNIISKKSISKYVPPNLNPKPIQNVPIHKSLYAFNKIEKNIDNKIIHYDKSSIEPITDVITEDKQNVQNVNHLKENITIENKSEIPYNLFQTWHSLNLPFYMNKYSKILRDNNPEFTYYLYDDTMCRNFIKDYYDNDTLYAYDSLIPGAYKADLGRDCVLYVFGGIYLDIKFVCMNDFKLNTIMNKEVYVRDYDNGIYQAFLICLPKNEILMSCIHNIIMNVKYKLYFKNALSITGPQLMNKYFTKKEINTLDFELNLSYILLKNKKILEIYKEYKDEQIKNQLNEHYSILWEKKRIYS